MNWFAKRGWYPGEQASLSLRRGGGDGERNIGAQNWEEKEGSFNQDVNQINKLIKNNYNLNSHVQHFWMCVLTYFYVIS